MNWFTKFLSWFSHREKVNLLNSTPSSLEIIPYTSRSNERLIPGIPKEPSINRKVGSRGLTYFNTSSGTNEWIFPQYDHFEIEIIYDIESYFARATRAKLSLFLREGFEFIGINDARVEYVRTRIAQIERVSGIPFDICLLDVCRDLIVHSNAFLLKVRNELASGGRIRTVGNKKLIPVAGYFRLPPETMIPETDASGNITRWKQIVGQTEKVFSTNDIVHFYTNRKAGYPLGVPSIIPVIDDIRALRSLEHNIDVLIHKHLFPIVLWKVGTDSRPAQTFSDGTTEIQVVQEAVANMPSEGSLVVSERYDVQAIGIENKALRVETYLQHFRDRLLAGLDISSIDVGVGNTSSRSTAQTLSRNLMDTVKVHQLVIEKFMQSVINELLLESTFDESLVLSSKNIVNLRFHEIDKEAKQAWANHLIDAFNKNAISYPELRIGIGREVLTPEEEKELWWNKFGREQTLIVSVDEVSNNSSTSTGGQAVSNNNQPENQYGKRPTSKLNKDFRDVYSVSKEETENPLLAWHNIIGKELQSRYAIGKLNLNLAESDIRTAYSTGFKEFLSILTFVIRTNYSDPETVSGLIRYIENRVKKSVKRLQTQIVERLRSQTVSPNVIFSTLAYRTVLIFDTELAYAENLAKYRWLVKNKIDMQIVSSGTSCDICRPKLTIIKWNDKLEEVNIPPFHPMCSCRIIRAEGDS